MPVYLAIQLGIVGLLIGATYGLVAIGLIVTYNGSGVLNFAHVATGAVGAYVYAEYSNNGGNTWVALVLGLGVGGAVGLVAYELVIRPLRRAPALAKMIATFALALIVQGLTTLTWGTDTMPVKSLFSMDTWSATAGGRLYIIGHNVVWTTILAVAVATALSLWFGRTILGRAIRASAHDERSAMRLGYRPTRLGAFTWASGGVLAALAAIIITPSLGGLNSTALAGTLIAGFATALVGGFRSLSLAVIAGFVLGMGQSILTGYVTTPGIADSLPFFVIALFLLVRSDAIPARDTITTERLPAVPNISRPWPFGVVSVVVLAVLPVVFTGYWVFVLAAGLALIPVFLSIVVLTGWTGQVSLAQFSVAAASAFTVAGLARHDWNVILATVVVTVLAFPLGVLLGWPALRVRGPSLAILSLGLAIAIPDLYVNRVFGTAENYVPTPAPFGHSLSIREMSYISLLATLVTIAGLQAFRRSRYGKTLPAIRASERAAVSIGIDVRRTKLAVFGVAFSLAAFGGALWAWTEGVLTSSQIDPLAGLQELSAGIVAGLGSPAGGAAAGLANALGPPFFAGPLHLSPTWFAIISGVLVIVTLRVHPDGVFVGNPIGKMIGSLVRRGRGADEGDPPAADAVTPARSTAAGRPDAARRGEVGAEHGR